MLEEILFNVNPATPQPRWNVVLLVTSRSSLAARFPPNKHPQNAPTQSGRLGQWPNTEWPAYELQFLKEHCPDTFALVSQMIVDQSNESNVLVRTWVPDFPDAFASLRGLPFSGAGA